MRAKGVKPMTIAVNERALVPTSDEEGAKRFLEPILADGGSCGDEEDDAESVEVLADQFAEVRRQTEDRVDVAALRAGRQVDRVLVERLRPAGDARRAARRCVPRAGNETRVTHNSLERRNVQ